jgi:NitT/TauT family transport system permease protein
MTTARTAVGPRFLEAAFRAAKPCLGFVVLIAAWQYGARLVRVPEYILPLPTVIAAKFWQTLPTQLHHLAATAATTLVGLVMALVVGVLLALAVIYVRALKAVVLPVLAAFNSIPKIAIAPLFVIWFGLGLESKILLAFLLALFPVFVNSLTGLDEIETDILDLSRLAGGTQWRIFAKVRLMNAVPYITDALKVAFPLALVGSIVGEFIGGNTGIGYLILSGQFNLDTPLVFASLLSITVFTTLGVGAVVLFEQFFLSWRPSRRSR